MHSKLVLRLLSQSMFIVQVCGQVFDRKTNFELTSPERPTVLELINAIQTSFSLEIAIRRPKSVPEHSFQFCNLKSVRR